MISETAKIYPNVQIGKNVVIEDFCVIGIPNSESLNQMTVIGDNSIIRSHTVIYAGNQIGHHFQTGNKANIRELNLIGNHVSIGTMSVVEHHVVIEDNVRIHTQVFIPEYSILKNGCWLGPNVVLTNAKYPLTPDAKKNLKGPTIETGARIGANSTVLPAINIGKNAMVGAGSVVTKNVAASAVVVGNPAKEIKKL